jgi:hypothetical protein
MKLLIIDPPGKNNFSSNGLNSIIHPIGRKITVQGR